MLPPEGCGPLRGSSSSEKQKPGLKSGQAVNNRVLWCEKGEPYKLHFCTFSEVVNNGPKALSGVSDWVDSTQSLVQIKLYQSQIQSTRFREGVTVTFNLVEPNAGRGGERPRGGRWVGGRGERRGKSVAVVSFWGGPW